MFAGAREPVRVLTEEQWSERLREDLGHEVFVRYSRARRYVLRVQDLCQAPGELRRPAGQGVLVRMNRFFAEAPTEVRNAVVSWVRSGNRARRASQLLDVWIQERIGHLERTQPRRVQVDLAGSHHDLAPLTEALRQSEFAAEFPRTEDLPLVTWGRRGKSRTRHSLQLGIYDYQARVVRIHRVLDQPAVPEFFVSFVLFHELLHAALDPRRTTAARDDGHSSATPAGRCSHHGPAFRRRERAYIGYPAALAWERRNLPALIRSARSGRLLHRQGLLRF